MSHNPIVAKAMNEQPDAADKEGSTYSGHVDRVVSQMPSSYWFSSFSSGESYYSNVVKTLRVGGRPMSPSNRLAVVNLIRDTD